MSQLFSTFKTKSSINGRTKFNLSQNHLTTMNFGQVLPVYHRNLIPSDKFHLKNIGAFARVAPLVVPTFGRCELNFVNVFVPYRLICEHSDAYIGGQDFDNGAPCVGRFFQLGDYIHWLYQHSTDGTADHYDLVFNYKPSSGPVTAQYRLLTAHGKHVYKTMCMLGYEIPQGTDGWNSTTHKNHLKQYNAFNLLCYMRALLDWIYPDDYFNKSTLAEDLNTIRTRHDNGDNMWKDIVDGVFDYFVLMEDVFPSNIPLFYNADYLTSMTRYPIENANGNNNTFMNMGDSINDNSSISNYRRSYDRDNNDNVMGSAQQEIGLLGANAVRALLAFDKWARKSNFTSQRYGEQMLSRFGIKVEDYKSNASSFLGTSSMPLNIGDVTSTAGTETESLGSYAGKGIINGDGKGASITPDEYGMFVTLCYITVQPIYYQGVERDNLRLAPQDYFMPEFENLGAMPISREEVACNARIFNPTADLSDVFGFQARYADYKVAHDQITGDFRNADMQAYHFGRDLTHIASSQLAESMPLRTYSDGDSFLRIFRDSDTNYDHFYLTLYFDVTANRPMLSISQSLDLGDGNLEIQRNMNSRLS